MAKTIPMPSRRNESLMVVTSPRKASVVPTGRLSSAACMILRTVACDAAQIALIDIGINVIDRLNVVVVDDDGRGIAVGSWPRCSATGWHYPRSR